LHNAIVGDQSDLVIGAEAVRYMSTDYDHRGGGVSRNVLTDRTKDHPDESSMPAGTNDQGIGAFGEVDQHPRRITAANLPPNDQARIFTEDFFHCCLQYGRRLQLWLEVSAPCDVAVRWVNGWRRSPNGRNGQLGVVRLGLSSGPSQRRLAVIRTIDTHHNAGPLTPKDLFSRGDLVLVR
jgi:hypothetical protein